ncbi:hypothetical protein VKT23_007404 [Stygiomarasmius scandens]|uniref:Uncharacterized protein n=1 Tax=Marasmiellus scandens TaxID=2682957 RepID=A0ABR1JN14_9AGAR
MTDSEREPSLLTLSDPEFYSEFLYYLHRDAERRWTHTEGSTLEPNMTLPIRSLDEAVLKRLYSVLDIFALISVSEPGNVAAVTASITQDHNGTLSTIIYIVFSRELSPTDAERVVSHFGDIFSILRDISIPGSEESSKVLRPESQDAFGRLLTSLYNFSWEQFARRVRKRHASFLQLRADVMEARQGNHSHFLDSDYPTLDKLFNYIEIVLEILDQADASDTATTIHDIYKRCIELHILSNDVNACDPGPLLGKLDRFMSGKNYSFSMQRWLSKIMSYHLGALKLSGLALSKRLRVLLSGTLDVKILPTIQAEPYTCELTSDNIKSALTQALEATGNSDLGDRDWQDEFASTVLDHVSRSGAHAIHRASTTVHSEIAMIRHIKEQEIGVLRYIGRSKLSCGACYAYMRADPERFVTRGSHGKFYPSWRLPSCSSEEDKDIRLRLVKLLQELLVKDFTRWVSYQKAERRKSDSSAGSDGGINTSYWFGNLEAKEKAREEARLRAKRTTSESSLDSSISSE